MRLCVICLSAFLLSCFVVWGSVQSDAPPQDATYCQLAKDPSLFIGKRIRIRAIYRYASEIQRLESPACCSEGDIKIWVEIELGLKGHSDKLFRKLDKGSGVALVVFVGRFDGGKSYGTFGDRFQLTVDGIEEVAQTSRSARRQDDPAWVPKNCENPNSLPAKQHSSTFLHEGLHADAFARGDSSGPHYVPELSAPPAATPCRPGACTEGG